jgi:hypothetical protein
MSIQAIKRGDILKTPKFNEPVRVVGDPRPSDGFIMLNLLGLRTKSYREGVIFTDAAGLSGTLGLGGTFFLWPWTSLALPEVTKTINLAW